jgi:hypothetical protein
MNCNDVRENLMNVLAEGQTAPEVLAHLRECGSCSQELEGLRRTMALLDEWEAPEPSPYFMTRLKAHVREEQRKPSRAALYWIQKPVMIGSLAGILAVGSAVFTYLNMNVGYVPVGPSAAVDVEALDKDHDLLTNNNNDLINEMAGLPSQDVTPAQDSDDDETI